MHLLIWLYTKSHRPCRRRNLSRGIWAKPKWWNRRRPNISHHLGASFCFPTAMLTAWRGNIDSMRQHTGEMVPFPCYRQRLLLQSSVQTVFSSRTANTTIFYTAIRLTDVAPSGPQSCCLCYSKSGLSSPVVMCMWFVKIEPLKWTSEWKI